MKIILFGATGMVGQGALRAALADAGVTEVLAVGRAAPATSHAKLRTLILPDLFRLADHADELDGFDACFFCLGIASGGQTEAAYRRITLDLPILAGRLLSQRNPGMVFVHVSAAGAASSERSRIMWARVKGAAENALRAQPFRAVYVIRPAIIQPEDGIRSRTRLYAAFYSAFGWTLPLLRKLAPSQLTTTGELGRLMLDLVRHGAQDAVLEGATLRRRIDA